MRGHLPFAAVTSTRLGLGPEFIYLVLRTKKVFQVTYRIDSSKTELIGERTESGHKQGFPTSHSSLRDHVAIDYYKYTE